MTKWKNKLFFGDNLIILREHIPNESVDFMVMGTVSRVVISGLFIGNAAERILSNINASVLTVKPEGFKTPVKQERKKSEEGRP